MSLIDFIKKHKLQSGAKSNIEKQQILSSIGLDNVGIFLRYGAFSSDVGIVNLHPSQDTHWVCSMNEK